VTLRHLIAQAAVLRDEERRLLFGWRDGDRLKVPGGRPAAVARELLDAAAIAAEVIETIETIADRAAPTAEAAARRAARLKLDYLADREAAAAAAAEVQARRRRAWERGLLARTAWRSGAGGARSDPWREPPPGYALWHERASDPTVLNRCRTFAREFAGGPWDLPIEAGDMPEADRIRFLRKCVGFWDQMETRDPDPRKPPGFRRGNGLLPPRVRRAAAAWLAARLTPGMSAADVSAAARWGAGRENPAWWARQAALAERGRAAQSRALIERDRWICELSRKLIADGKTAAAAAGIVAGRLSCRPDLGPALTAAGARRVIGRDVRRWRCLSSARAARAGLVACPAEPGVRRGISGAGRRQPALPARSSIRPGGRRGVAATIVPVCSGISEVGGSINICEPLSGGVAARSAARPDPPSAAPAEAGRAPPGAAGSLNRPPDSQPERAADRGAAEACPDCRDRGFVRRRGAPEPCDCAAGADYRAAASSPPNTNAGDAIGSSRACPPHSRPSSGSTLG